MRKPEAVDTIGQMPQVDEDGKSRRPSRSTLGGQVLTGIKLSMHLMMRVAQKREEMRRWCGGSRPAEVSNPHFLDRKWILCSTPSVSVQYSLFPLLPKPLTRPPTGKIGTMRPFLRDGNCNETHRVLWKGCPPHHAGHNWHWTFHHVCLYSTL